MKEAFISKFFFCVAMAFFMVSCNQTPKPTASSDSTNRDSIKVNSSEKTKESRTKIDSRLQVAEFKFPLPSVKPLSFHTQTIQLKDTTFDLTLPEKWNIKVVQEGFGRPRFLSKSLDGRLFLTDMKNRSDNSKGKVFILDGFDKNTAQFDTCITYLDKLRNPNNLAFHTDTLGNTWLYLALTQKLVRYNYQLGETTPTSEEEVIAEFPDYGLSYKYGGWHLTRTVAIHNEKVYVSVGSSCNACEEKEPERASILEMDLDGANISHYADGVRNAVDINWIHGSLFSTNMGADHLGDDAPDEALYKLERGAHYGWPYFYQFNGEIWADTSEVWEHNSLLASEVPLAYSELGGHTAPLGFEYFEGENWPHSIRNYFLIALHGSGHIRIGNGYNLVRVAQGMEPEPVISGWLRNGHRFGRPTDVFIYDQNSFFITDDHKGVLYFVEISE
ncbi:MAG: sorbosone dehydrogenase family protein [Flavobacteriales bacterium]